MKTLTIVPAPQRFLSTPKWWPDLYLKKGRNLQLITPEQCGPVRDIFNAGRGFSEIARDMVLHDRTGKKIGHVSYNGRVWLHDIEGNVEVPVRGCETCEQLDAKGWGA